MTNGQQCGRTFFKQDIDEELGVTPETTLNSKLPRIMKNLQASYNGDVNNIISQANQENALNENLNFLTDVCTGAM